MIIPTILFGSVAILVFLWGCIGIVSPTYGRYLYIRVILLYASIIKVSNWDDLSELEQEIQLYDSNKEEFSHQYKNVLRLTRVGGIVGLLVSTLAIWYLFF